MHRRFPVLSVLSRTFSSIAVGAVACAGLANASSSSFPPTIQIDPVVEISPFPQSATVVIQDTASWLVSEFDGNLACAYPNFDTLVPFAEGRYALTRVDWNVPMLKMDSASAEKCRKVSRYRRIDRLPLLRLEGKGEIGALSMPYSPDTIKFCRDGICSSLPTRKVRTPTADNSQCLVAALSPFETHQQALDFLAAKVAQSKSALRLTRQRIYYIQAARAASDVAVASDVSTKIVSCIEPYEANSFVAPGLQWPEYLQPVSSWNDPRVGSAYALPSLANANDLYGQESLTFYVDTVDLGDGSRAPYTDWRLATWSYPTGVEGYLYRGSTISYADCGGVSGSGPSIFADTLATSGENLLVTNAQPQCGRRDVDGLAATNENWFALLPWTGEPLESVFRHYGSVETDWSWPMEGDSILVRGQKVAIAELRSTSGIANRRGLASGFEASVVGKSISVDLGRAGELRVVDAAGHVLTSRVLAQGRSLVALPTGARGMLVLQVNGNRKSVVVP